MKISAVIASVEAILKPYIKLESIEFRERFVFKTGITKHEISVFFDRMQLPDGAESLYGNFFITYEKGYTPRTLEEDLHEQLNQIGIVTQPIVTTVIPFDITVGRKKRKNTGNGHI